MRGDNAFIVGGLGVGGVIGRVGLRNILKYVQ